MYVLFILVVYLLDIANCEKFNVTRKRGLNRALPRVEHAHMVEISDMQDLRYIATALEYLPDNTLFFLGNGIILNKFYILVTYNLAEPYAGDTTNLFISAGFLAPLDSVDGDVYGDYRAIEEAILYPGYDKTINPIIGNIALLRVCPGFFEGFYGKVPIAPALADSPYRDIWTKVTYYQFQETPDGLFALHQAKKYVAHKCECLYENDWWVSAYHVCLEHDNLVSGVEPEDENGVIVTNEDNTEIVGTLMTFQRDWGEVVLWPYQEDQKAWLDQNTNTEPLQYPPGV